MNTKQCTYCTETKSIELFYKNRTYCKECARLKDKLYRRTKKGLIKVIFGNQKVHSKPRGHKPPEYNLTELREWVFKQDIFHKLYDKWAESNYFIDITPSIDRYDDSIGYIFSNIRIVTWKENKDKQTEDFKSGKLKNDGLLNGGHKSVIQMDLKGNIIKKFISRSEASRNTNTLGSCITVACKDSSKTAGGFKWAYA